MDLSLDRSMIHEDKSFQISVGDKIKKDLDKIVMNFLKVNSFFANLNLFASKVNKENIILQTNAHHNSTAYSPQCI